MLLLLRHVFVHLGLASFLVAEFIFCDPESRRLSHQLVSKPLICSSTGIRPTLVQTNYPGHSNYQIELNRIIKYGHFARSYTIV